MTIISQLQQLNLPTPPDVSQQKKDIEYLRRARRDISKKINELEKEIKSSVVSEAIIDCFEKFYSTQTDNEISETIQTNGKLYTETGDCFNLNLALAAHRVQCKRKLERVAA